MVRPIRRCAAPFALTVSASMLLMMGHAAGEEATVLDCPGDLKVSGSFDYPTETTVSGFTSPEEAAEALLNGPVLNGTEATIQISAVAQDGDQVVVTLDDMQKSQPTAQVTFMQAGDGTWYPTTLEECP